MDVARTVVRAEVLVVGDRVVAIGPAVPSALAGLPSGRADRTIDARGAWVLPGFVHGHMHLCQTLFRGLAEQSDLLRWLREAIWPLEAAHTDASLAASVRLGAGELIRGGVTCVNDMGTVHHGDALAETLAASGLRAVFGPALMDQGQAVPARLLEGADRALERALALADRWHGAAEGRLSVALAPRFILSCSESLWRDVTAASRARGLLVHTHLAEAPTEGAEVKAAVGQHAAPYFAEHGFMHERFVGAHGVWLDETELALMKRADAALVVRARVLGAGDAPADLVEDVLGRAGDEQAAAGSEDPDEVAEAGAKRPAAEDTRRGHVLLAAESSVVAPAAARAARFHLAGERVRVVRVIRARRGTRAEIRDLESHRGEPRLDLLLELEPGVVRRDGDALGHQLLRGHCGQVRVSEPTAFRRFSATRSAASYVWIPWSLAVW